MRGSHLKEFSVASTLSVDFTHGKSPKNYLKSTTSDFPTLPNQREHHFCKSHLHVEIMNSYKRVHLKQRSSRTQRTPS